MTQTIAIIDFGFGNLASVQKAFFSLGHRATVVQDSDDLIMFDRVILPGVGSFETASFRLRQSGMFEAILEFAKSGKSLLGICLGMQLLATTSEECKQTEPAKSVQGLDLIHGEVISLRSLGVKSRVPHVGWNSLHQNQHSCLFETIPDKTDVYFVHSFGFVPEDSSVLLAYTEHDIQISALVAKENVVGCQFHPEKSGRAGYVFLLNWVNSC